jgi:hypothetical protein
MNFAIDTFPKERFGLVTGSTCSVLFPQKGEGKKGLDTYAKKLANEMFFNFYDEFSNWKTEHGKMGEHFAFMHYEKYIDSGIKPGRFIQKLYCGGTTDAEVSGVKGVDFKCPTTLAKWLDYLHEPLDKKQLDQCQMYMYLSGLTAWEIAAYLTESQFMNDNGLTYPVPEEKRMIIIQVKKDCTWEDSLMAVLPTVIAKRNIYLETLQNHFNGNERTSNNPD